MDIFEYCTVILYFVNLEDSEGKWIIDQEFSLEFTVKKKGLILIQTFESNGEKPSEVKEEMIWLDSEFSSVRISKSIFPNQGNYPALIGDNVPLLEMGPILAMLGQRGWEVVEYKTATDPPFGQALLKRKIQKE